MNDCCHYDDGYEDGYEAARKAFPGVEDYTTVLRLKARERLIAGNAGEAEYLELLAAEISADPGMEERLKRWRAREADIVAEYVEMRAVA